MENVTKNILCYSHIDFNNIMKRNEWYYKPGVNTSAISICSTNDELGDSTIHWFEDDCHDTVESVFNLDIDDIGPYWFTDTNIDFYDMTFELYINGNINESNSYFDYDDKYHILNWEEAFDLVKWIDNRINNFDNTIYIHCAAGVSRSQGVVRYIIDTYSDQFNIVTNRNNPCITPNLHVTRMLKRAYWLLFDEKI